MKQIRLTPRAHGDLAEIRRYTRKAWGAVQARRYLEELGLTIEAIAAGEVVTTSIVAGGRLFGRCRHKDHHIFFRTTEGSLEVIRVFHGKMDLVSRLSEE